MVGLVLLRRRVRDGSRVASASTVVGIVGGLSLWFWGPCEVTRLEPPRPLVSDPRVDPASWDWRTSGRARACAASWRSDPPASPGASPAQAGSGPGGAIGKAGRPHSRSGPSGWRRADAVLAGLLAAVSGLAKLGANGPATSYAPTCGWSALSSRRGGLPLAWALACSARN